MTIALWTVLAAALLPILTTGLAKRLGGAYDNSDPRGSATGYGGMAKRAHAAHQNGFEAFPLFAAAVLVAEMKGAPRGLIDGLAVIYLCLRVGYTAAYVYDKPTIRSVVWTLALVTAIAIFVSPMWR